jgi:hypothetical protein
MMARRRVKRSVYRDETFWAAEVERQSASGLTVEAYCQQRGLALSTFWRKRLELQGPARRFRQQAAGPVLSAHGLPPLQAPSPARNQTEPVVTDSGGSHPFIELGPALLNASNGNCPLRIQLPGGIHIEVGHGCPDHLWQQAVRLLHSRPESLC